MGKQNIDFKRRVKQDCIREQEIIERGEQMIDEARQMYSPSSSPFDFEVIDIDDIAALMECGKQYSVNELVSQFGISVNVAHSLLAPRNCIDKLKKITGGETTKAIDSVFCDADLSESAEPFVGDLLLNEIAEFGDEELVQMAYELEHAFD